jgi:hypothetical protein
MFFCMLSFIFVYIALCLRLGRRTTKEEIRVREAKACVLADEVVYLRKENEELRAQLGMASYVFEE